MFKIVATKLIVLSCLGFVWAQQDSTSSPAQEPSNSQVQPDNTKVNKRDRQEGQVTADQQKENQGDRKVAQEIRKAIVKDKSLSTYAHNVKIVSENGVVTLKGPVHSEQEKEAVEAKAAQIAGADKVKSEISVAPDKSGNSPQ